MNEWNVKAPECYYNCKNQNRSKLIECQSKNNNMDNVMYCRLCLSNNNEFFTASSELRTKIAKHLNIQIAENEFVCKRCTEIVESFDQYHMEIHKHQKEFQLRTKKNEVIIILVEQHNSTVETHEEIPVYDDALQSNEDHQDKIDVEDTNCFVERTRDEVLLPIHSHVPTISSTIMDDSPQQIIKNGKLIVKGKELTKMISKFYKLECDICPNKRFRKFSALVTHFRSQHSIPRPYVHCCNMKISRLRRIALHMARHIQPSAFQCNLCNKFLTSPKILLLHMQNHLPEEKRQYACPEVNCNRRFSYQSALVNHSLSHLSEEDRSVFTCCDKKFANSSRLKSHIAAVHSTVQMRRFTCDICSRVFTTRSNLIYHITTHQIGHKVQCKLCSKWLKNKICLKKHMTTHSETKFSCEMCNYTSQNKQCLVNHQKVHHSEDKPFNCETCGNSFKLKNTLINHINALHKGLRKYKCEFCAKTFVSSGNYYAHRKRIHSEELSKKLKEKEQNEDNRRNNSIFE